MYVGFFFWHGLYWHLTCFLSFDGRGWCIKRKSAVWVRSTWCKTPLITLVRVITSVDV